ncbi:hypothetical protein PR048_002560 [Dryococelus australis]|uniref:YqaJ viral recombinase domain-containing protein n=1 Tax=Dryococelus australis TaxID=614101 RepID=A0ABQ9IKK0_9NEOP|nr:hypothetical protein PR048_002560 [Dryococelus australis]
MLRISQHNKVFYCSFEGMQLTEEHRKGISSCDFQCNMCGTIKTISSEDPRENFNSNMAWVNSMLLTGQSFTQLQEITSTLEIPCIAKETSNKCQKELSSVIHDVACCKRRSDLALEKGNADFDGVSLIAVVNDGAWCKRSYGNKYDALSGVVFKCSVLMHNLKYHQLIGDGDSNIMNQLMKARLYGPNFTIAKIECSNHILRNYLRRIRGIAQKTKKEGGPVSPVLRKAVSDKQLHLRAAVTGAVHHRPAHKDLLIHIKIEELKRGIYNGPFHGFCDHTGCELRGYLISGSKENEEYLAPSLQRSGIWQEIIAARNIVARHAVSLLHNVNTNPAESFNNVVCKYISSKRINFSLRGCYQTRSELSVISYNSCHQTQSFIHKGLTKNCPESITKAHIQHKEQKKAQEDGQTIKIEVQEATDVRSDSDYGCIELGLPDMEPDFLANLRLTEKERENLQIATKGQSDSLLWKADRLKRLTLSHFGTTCKMKKSTERGKSVVNILYSKFSGTAATRYGLENERDAIEDFEFKSGKKVARCGLFVDLEYPLLAASPDVLVGDDGILEVKCPTIASRLTPEEVVKEKKVQFCNIVDGKMFLKDEHAYMYQVHKGNCILQITNTVFLFFGHYMDH